MSACKLIEVYQDVVDIKDQNFDNYKYLIPVEGDSNDDFKCNTSFISDFYNKVADDQSNNKTDAHIYESLYEFSKKQFCNSNKLRQPPLPDRRLSRSEHTIKRNRKKIEKEANDAKNRFPLSDCSNWTLSSTCGEQFFKNSVNNDNDKTLENKGNDKTLNDNNEFDKSAMKEDEDNTLFHKLRNRKKQSKAQRKLPKSNKSSYDCNMNSQPKTQLEPKINSCKTKTQPGRNTFVFFQHKQSKKNLEEHNPNLNPIRSTDLGTEKMFKKDKDNKIKSKITNSYKNLPKSSKDILSLKFSHLHRFLTDIKLKLANIRKKQFLS